MDKYMSKYPVVEFLGQSALFVEARLDPEKLPSGLYMYDIRGDENGDWANGGQVKPSVWVNWVASILVKTPIHFKDEVSILYDEDESPNFTGDEMTIQEFLKSDY